jgi:predicted amidohydrolase YtcJ
VQAGLAALKPGAWLQGDGWDEGKLAERRYLTAADLDRVSPDNPVWLMHTTGHYGAANSVALRLAKIGARTAWLFEDWNKKSTDRDTGNSGYPSTEPEVYRRMVRLFHQAGIHVGTHAVGDRAIDWVVDTYAQVLAEIPTHGLRHSIIHANIPSEHAIQVMSMLEGKYDAAYPEAQAPFMWWLGDTYAANFGPERSRRLLPLNTFLKHGIHWGGGSDYSVTPVAARYGLWASVERETLKGTYGAHPFGTAEAVDIHAALRSYTIWGARQLFLEQRIGSLELGKDADIAVWDRDMYEIPSPELKNLKCELTILHGEVVYAANP